MGQALYRTYRSRTLSEVVGQEHITDTLTTALKKGFISHAYLFTGPRGVGKTSIARILAHEINQLPYSDESIHLDIIEIDAASNRRIDEIRDLRDKVHIAPTSAKYKVYIIDEVHMLTREAFNALLKTLEEPPAHVVFILATTEVHKLPETIISRTQRFTFRPISTEKAVGHLREIAKKEKLKITDGALLLIAQHGGGSFRDSIGVLDQMRGLSHEVTEQDVAITLGIAPAELMQNLLSTIEQHDAPQTVTTLTQLTTQGAEAAQIAKQLGELLRERFIAGEQALSHQQTIHLLTKLLDVPQASNPRVFLEIVLLDVVLAGRQQTATPAPPSGNAQAPTSTLAAKSTPKKPVAPKVTAPEIVAAKLTPAVQQPVTPEPIAQKTSTPAINASAAQAPVESTAQAPPAKATTSNTDATLNDSSWQNILAAIRKDYNTLYSILRNAQPTFTPGKLTVTVGYAFHQKRLNESRNKQIIATTIEQLTGQTIQISCELGEQKTHNLAMTPSGDGELTHSVPTQDANKTAAASGQEEPFDYYIQQANEASDRPLDTVSNIFGGGELLES